MNNVTKALAALALLVTACDDDDDRTRPPTEVPPDGGPGGEILSACRRIDLVSDQQGRAQTVDPNLVNAWGLERGDNAFVIAAEDTGVVAIYDGGGRQSVEAMLRSGALNLGEGITGVARTHSALFSMTAPDGTQLVADYIFANEDGRLIAVSTAVDGGASQVFADQEGAGYTGVAVLSDRTSNTNLILAADFQRGQIVAFDTTLSPVQLPLLRSSVTAFQAPDLPQDFAPFNIAVLDNRIFVAYARQELGTNEEGEPVFEEVKGAGLGRIVEFDINGQFVRTIANGGDLNAPWGMTLAPAGFCSLGVLSNDANLILLVGNFGDGKLIPIELGSVVDDNGVVTESLALSPLADSTGTTIAIDGLWGIMFGDGTVGLASNLYFAAGPDDEEHGLYGRLEAFTLQD